MKMDFIEMFYNKRPTNVALNNFETLPLCHSNALAGKIKIKQKIRNNPLVTPDVLEKLFRKTFPTGLIQRVEIYATSISSRPFMITGYLLQ